MLSRAEYMERAAKRLTVTVSVSSSSRKSVADQLLESRQRTVARAARTQPPWPPRKDYSQRGSEKASSTKTGSEKSTSSKGPYKKPFVASYTSKTSSNSNQHVQQKPTTPRQTNPSASAQPVIAKAASVKEDDGAVGQQQQPQGAKSVQENRPVEKPGITPTPDVAAKDAHEMEGGVIPKPPPSDTAQTAPQPMEQEAAQADPALVPHSSTQ